MHWLIMADQDILVIGYLDQTSEDNAQKMVAVLSDFGFGSLGLTLSDFLKENYVTQLGYPPLRIDIFKFYFRS